MTTERDRRNQEAFKVKQAREAEREKIAKSMLADGMPVERISQYTGLTAEEINSLQ